MKHPSQSEPQVPPLPCDLFDHTQFHFIACATACSYFSARGTVTARDYSQKRLGTTPLNRAFPKLVRHKRDRDSKMTNTTHAMGVELLKLIVRSKDPLPPKFYCQTCKQKFTIKISPTSPVSAAVLRLAPAQRGSGGW